jgi:uncharacterized protein
MCLRGVPAFLLCMAVRAQTVDVVVVGAGAGGLCTALEATRRGAKVAVVDMASVFGGHAVVSEGGILLVDTPLQRSLGIQDSIELARRDMLALGEDNSVEWVDLYLRESKENIHDWLTGMGVQFVRVRPIAGNSVPRFHENPKRGFGVVEPIYRACLNEKGIEFYWNVKVERLIVKEGKVTGVEGVSARSGERVRWDSRAVVLATGGFQSNREIVLRNWPAEVPKPLRLLLGSGWNSQGSGLVMGKEAGAVTTRLDHQWNYAEGLPDPRYPGLDRGLNVRNPTGGVWLNVEGKRFTNETAGERGNILRLTNQTGGRYWLVFDAEGRKRLMMSGTDWGDAEKVDRLILGNPEICKRAQSLEELPAQTGMPAETVKASISRYNELVARGVDEDFGRFGPGSKTVFATPVPVEKPPFYALTMFAVTRKSMGGLAIDLDCRVLDEGGKAIPGLSAVGEVTGMGGINGRAALEGTFLAPSMLQGRRTGKRLGEELGSKPATTSCRTCHAIEKLVTESRPGYTHFERVHRVVIERKYDCKLCHGELDPFRAGAHKINAGGLVSACERCHVGG